MNKLNANMHVAGGRRSGRRCGGAVRTRRPVTCDAATPPAGASDAPSLVSTRHSVWGAQHHANHPHEAGRVWAGLGEAWRGWAGLVRRART